MSDIVERLQMAAIDAIHDDAKAAILEAIDEIARLEADNFALAAGSCDVPNGKIGDEHGHFYCTKVVEITRLREANGALALQADEWEGKYQIVSGMNVHLFGLLKEAQRYVDDLCGTELSGRIDAALKGEA